MFLRTVRQLLQAFGGYESKESRGQIMAAFPSACAAAEWAMALQLALLEVPWPDQLAALVPSATILEPSTPSAPAAVVLFRGIRARVGLFRGAVELIVPHGRSGRADYLGPAANRAARLMGAAQGGQASTLPSISRLCLDLEPWLP